MTTFSVSKITFCGDQDHFLVADYEFGNGYDHQDHFYSD